MCRWGGGGLGLGGWGWGGLPSRVGRLPITTPELASGRGGVPVTNFRGLSGGDNPLTQGAQGGKSPPENFEK